MDEDQEMERFGIENDYEGGQWIGGEFYYRFKKEKRTQTKDDAIYGTFACGSSDSDSDGRRSNKRSKRDLIRKPDLSKPVQFVSTGSFMPSQEIDGNTEENTAVAESALEYRNSSQGLGYAPKVRVESEKVGDSDEDENFLPTAFGRKIKEAAQRKEKEREEREKEKLRAGRKSTSRREAGPDVGKFENHTRGIGLKLMEKMGYRLGSGLGKDEQGITAPIEAKMRPQGMGMGFNDYKEVKLPSLDEPVKEDKATVTVATFRSREKRWLKQKQGKKKAEYMTAEELLAKKQEQGLEVFQEKILDMRGPQARVLSNLENLNAEEEAKENQVPMPELQHNVRLIVDMAEFDIQKIDKELRLEREKVASLHREKEKLQREAARQKQQLEVMETIAKTVKQVEQDNLSGVLTLESLLRIFIDLKARFAEDYKLFNISSIACSFAVPLLIRVFQGWEPLQNPLHGLTIMSSWRDLLQGDQPFDYSGNLASSYAQLVSEVILPAVRISGTNSWQARDPEPMLRFLESWEKLLPPPILQSVLEHVIMPKLSAAVDSWDPRRETVPIHVWIHPWLPLLGPRLDILYHTIRFKLGNVLHAWHASDASAYAILSPWKGVFDAASWENLIVRFIVPKLMAALQEFQINPANQNLEQFNWVMTWAAVVPIQHMVNMLEIGFFSKWQQVLYHWLCSNPDFNEVMKWYMGWKGLFPPELLANERIRVLLTAGLDMMNQAVEGMELVQPGARENVSYLRVTEKRQFEAQQQATGYMAHMHTSMASANGFLRDGMGAKLEMSLKEVIEAYAVEQGLMFVPKVGRSHNGLPVYGFGNVSICIDSVKKLLYAQSPDGWDVVTLNQLLQMQQATRHR
ncbi:Zinc finger CCCH domain-containing protein 22 [Apostasia shenzhenica]|uniref:Zinc finger CCCH domain-containing protein 22 n=1 Tax=Apostasia shenzhenica TaxID=1088818 RepID=A0A2H9ZX30_9ASPA|nr:Zinc finger CCCH domain-containing protein 22 [Apostasia shenzhenica]